jgi:hypothetical protein
MFQLTPYGLSIVPILVMRLCLLLYIRAPLGH